jgi:hypothetical protein
MAAKRKNIVITQGETYRQVFTWKLRWPSGATPTPVDLTGCSARMHVRELLETPTTLLELSTANGRITLGGLAGTITIDLSAEDTAALTWLQGVYDIEIVFATGEVRRLLEGGVKVNREVTRA